MADCDPVIIALSHRRWNHEDSNPCRQEEHSHLFHTCTSRTPAPQPRARPSTERFDALDGSSFRGSRGLRATRRITDGRR